jgi:hypothetical protein
MYSQYSSYDQSYKEPTIRSNPTYSTTQSAPIIITVDNYDLTPENAIKNKYSFNFAGTNDATGGSSAEIDLGAIRDVVSIELIYANVPIVDGELYSILRLNNYARVRSSNKHAKNSYCLIHNQNPGSAEYYSVRRLGTPDDTMIYYFPEPTKLNKLDIEFVNPLGEVIWFTETGEAPVGNEDIIPVRYVLTFEIRTLNRGPPKPDARFNNPVKGPW